MQPDKPFNYWDNHSTSPTPAGPPVPPAQPVQAAPTTMSPVIAAPTRPVQQMAPAQPQPLANQSAQPVAPIPTASLHVAAPLPEAAPTTMYEPKEQPIEVEPELVDGQDDYRPGEDEDEDYEEEPVHWAASEYIKQEKNTVWFIVSAVVAVGLILLDIFLLKSYTFSVLVVVMAIALIVLSRRPPAEVNYTLSPSQGLYVGEVLHSYEEFKSFGVINDNGNNFIKLIPVKRFGLGVSVYFPVELGEVIVDILGSRLPMEDLKLDVFDAVIRKLRL